MLCDLVEDDVNIFLLALLKLLLQVATAMLVPAKWVDLSHKLLHRREARGFFQRLTIGNINSLNSNQREEEKEEKPSPSGALVERL